jgi:membrane-bound lytic murein transglycosylase MltF
MSKTNIFVGVFLSLLLGAASQAQSSDLTNPTALVDNGPYTGDLQGLVERRIVRLLTVYGPGRYYLDNGAKGVTAEYANRLEKVINESFDTGHLKVAVFVLPVARDELFLALEQGRGDIIIAGTTITPAREQRAAFTIPSSKPLKEILVMGPSAPPINSIDDLSGKSVYLRASSSYSDSIATLNERFTREGKALVTVEPMSELLEDEDLIEMVDAGLLPWTIVDDYKPTQWSGVFTNLTVRNDIIFRKGSRHAWAVRQDNPELKKFLNNFLKDNKEGTLFGNILKNRYVRDFNWAANTNAESELQRYRDLEALFRRHGVSYGIDPALLAAQGFQESRLDQNVRSGAGAVGVMQLLPSTAADKNVGIPNIHEVDPNIEAGAKYLAFLKRRYFSTPGMDPLNGALLALAAYNAGPAKVRRLQETARTRGYDPYRWFDNVEVIAAEKIGRETVQYVANIFKYYLSYQMINRESARREAARQAAGAPTHEQRQN